MYNILPAFLTKLIILRMSEMFAIRFCQLRKYFLR